MSFVINTEIVHIITDVMQCELYVTSQKNPYSYIILHIASDRPKRNHIR